MNTSTVKSRFLTHPEDLGIVTVGFSGGQVRIYIFLFFFWCKPLQARMLTCLYHSPKLV